MGGQLMRQWSPALRVLVVEKRRHVGRRRRTLRKEEEHTKDQEPGKMHGPSGTRREGVMRGRATQL